MGALLDKIYEMKKGMKIMLGVGIVVILVGLGVFANYLHGNMTDHEGMARTPSVSSKQKGKNYADVEAIFRSSGFTNISYSKIEDLVTGWITKDGEVEKVMVGGTEGYTARTWVPADTEVVIYYHTFSGGKDK